MVSHLTITKGTLLRVPGFLIHSPGTNSTGTMVTGAPRRASSGSSRPPRGATTTRTSSPTGTSSTCSSRPTGTTGSRPLFPKMALTSASSPKMIHRRIAWRFCRNFTKRRGIKRSIESCKNLMKLVENFRLISSGHLLKYSNTRRKHYVISNSSLHRFDTTEN